MTGSEFKELILSSPQNGQRSFYNEYKNYVYTIVYSKLGNCGTREDIEECVSDVFAEIFLNAERYCSMGDLKGITGIIAKRKAIRNYHRLSGSRIIFDELDESISDDHDISAESEKKEKSRILFGKIKGLGEPDSTIILMSFFYGLDSGQIASRLSMKSAAVRKRKQRALKKLRSLLSGTGIGEEW